MGAVSLEGNRMQDNPPTPDPDAPEHLWFSSASALLS